MAPSLPSLLRRCRTKCLVLLVTLGIASLVLIVEFRSLAQFEELARFARNEAKQEVKTILFWGNLYHKKWSESYIMHPGNRSCGEKGLRCLFSDDRDLYLEADAVVFHAVSDNVTDVPDLSLRPPSQIWVFHDMEMYYNVTYDSNPWLWSLFNWTHTFLSASDVQMPYGKITRDESGYLGGFDSNRNYMAGRTKSVVALISDCVQPRMDFVRQLRRYIDVVVYGRCGIAGCPRWTKGCWDLIKNFKFYLAWENHICKDYVTEKLYVNALRHGIVPIVAGGANYSDPLVAPPHSYINALDFRSAKELGTYLHHVGNNPQLYNTYFQWRSQYSVHYHLDEPENTFCGLCEALHNSSRPTKHYSNVINWFLSTRNCTSYPESEYK